MVSHCGLISISMMANDLENLFMCLFTTHIMSLKKYLFTCLFLFSIKLFSLIKL